MIKIDELFEKIKIKAQATDFDPSLAGQILLDITGDESRHWLINLSGGRADISIGNSDTPDVTVTASSETVIRLAMKELKPAMALLTGMIKVKGKSEMLAQLQYLWPEQAKKS